MAKRTPTVPALLALVWLAVAAPAAHTQPIEQGSLEVGALRSFVLGTGDRHRLTLYLGADELVEIQVQQIEVDLVVRIVRPDGDLQAEIDGPGIGAPEELSWIASTAGTWALEIAAYGGDGHGAYEVSWNTRRVATPADRELREARRVAEEALIHFNAGRGADAEPLFERAMALFEAALGSAAAEVGTMSNYRGLVRFQMGRYAEATTDFARALEIRRGVFGSEHGEVVLVERNLARAHMELGRYADAEPLLLHAIEALGRLVGPDRPEITAYLNDLGTLYRNMSRHAESIALFERTLAIRERSIGPDHPDVAMSLNNLAQLYREVGRYGDAEPLFFRSLSVRERAQGPEHMELVTPLSNLGSLYSAMGRHADAEPYFLRAIAIGERQLGPEHPELVSALNNLAELYRKTDRYGEAGALHERVIRIMEANLGPEHPQLAASLANLAAMYREQGRYADAEPLYLRSLDIRERVRGPNDPNTALGLRGLAELRLAQGRPGDAAPLLDRAVRVLSAAYGDPDDLIAALSSRSQARWALSDTAGALADGRALLDHFEALRPAVGGDQETRASFLATRGAAYHRMVEWLIAAGDPLAALDYVERASARAFADQLALGGVDLRAGVAPGVLEPLERREQVALTGIASYQQRIRRTRGDRQLSEAERAARLAALDDSLRSADRELRLVSSEIRHASPTWRDVLTASGAPVPFDSLQRSVVPPEGMVLRFQLGASSAHVFVIGPEGEGLEVYPLTVTEELAGSLGTGPGPFSAARAQQLLLTERASGAGFVPVRGAGVRRGQAAAPESGIALRRVLLPDPLWERVRRAREVIVVPDGALHYRPFDALVTGLGPDGAPRYWLEEGPPIRYAASATVLYNLERRAGAASSAPAAGVLSLSDPEYDPADGAVQVQDEPMPTPAPEPPPTGRQAFERAASLARLPGTARETEAIRAHFGTDPARGGVTVLQGRDADERRLREALGAHRYLHLATHGLVDESRSSMFASLALTPPGADTHTSDDDGFLQLHEIYGLSLSGVALAVLSACETNVGEGFVGEGVFALSRGFLVAGAQRVVASQWSVDDASTAVLIGAFFGAVAEAERAGEEVDYARALRAAQLAVRNDPDHPEWADPYHWAPFVLTGRR